MFDVNTSLLRFWETEFPMLRPKKSTGGARLYTEKDIDLIRRLLYLTKDLGYTLDGAREQLRRDRQNGAADKLEEKSAAVPRQEIVRRLNDVRQQLLELKALVSAE